ncbi:hypothetical protein P9112_000839 [Eukaryota sp. TZLM1-RC]
MVGPQRSRRRLKQADPYLRNTQSDNVATTIAAKLTSPTYAERLSACELLGSLQYPPSQLLTLLKRNSTGQNLVNLLLDPNTNVSHTAIETICTFTSTRSSVICNFFFSKDILSTISSLLNTSPSPLLLDLLASLCSGSNDVASALVTSPVFPSIISIASLHPEFQQFHDQSASAWECLVAVLEVNDLEDHVIKGLIGSLKNADFKTLSQASIFVSHLLWSYHVIDDEILNLSSEIFKNCFNLTSDVSLNELYFELVQIFKVNSGQTDVENDNYSQLETQLQNFNNKITSISSLFESISLLFSEPADEIPEYLKYLPKLIPIDLLFKILISFLTQFGK